MINQAVDFEAITDDELKIASGGYDLWDADIRRRTNIPWRLPYRSSGAL